MQVCGIRLKLAERLSLCEKNLEGGFFVFEDVSVKCEGQYRLRFTLFEMLQ